MPELAKKTAEVAAFAKIGQELLDRSGKAGQKAFGPEMAGVLAISFKEQADWAKGKADAAKLEKTLAKLRGMMETYIGDNWDDSVEILEWSGFFFGAAAVHWAVVAGLAKKDPAASEFAHQQGEQCHSWLKVAMQNIGQASS